MGHQCDICRPIQPTQCSSGQLPVLQGLWFHCPYVALHGRPIVSEYRALERLCVVPDRSAAEWRCSGLRTGRTCEDSTATGWPTEEMRCSLAGAPAWKPRRLSAVLWAAWSLRQSFPSETGGLCSTLYEVHMGSCAPDSHARYQIQLCQ